MKKVFFCCLFVIMLGTASYGEDVVQYVTSVKVTGNPNIAEEYILNVVDTKP